MLTLIAPAAHGARVKASIAAAGGGYRLRVTIGRRSLSFLVTRDGQIRLPGRPVVSRLVLAGSRRS
jgi:hypothetical protein